MKKIISLVLVLGMVFSLAACSTGGSKDKVFTEEDIIKSNDTKHKITMDEFNKVLEDFKAYYMAQANSEEQWNQLMENPHFVTRFRSMVLQTMVLDRIFYNEAEINKFIISDKELNEEFEKFKANFNNDDYAKYLKENKLTEDEVKTNIKKEKSVQNFSTDRDSKILSIQPSKEELQKLYDTNKLQFDKVRASHILVDTEDKAKEIKSKLDAGEKFEDLAKEFSKCPSKDNGGDLDFFTFDKMDQQFSQAAFSLKIGEISEPVNTQFGWHIIKVTDKKETFDKANEEEIVNLYHSNIKQKMYDNYLLNANLDLPEELQALWDSIINIIKDQGNNTEKEEIKSEDK